MKRKTPSFGYAQDCSFWWVIVRRDLIVPQPGQKVEIQLDRMYNMHTFRNLSHAKTNVVVTYCGFGPNVCLG
jgi:hypothetical protein